MEEEVSLDDSSDDYEREQLEIALYSQIHFDENDDYQFPETKREEEDDNNAVDNNFIISVQGNEKIGFVASETNADIVLNDTIEKKYRNSSTSKDNTKVKKDSLNIKTSKSVNNNSTTSSIQKHGKQDSSVKEINNATKIHSMLRNTRGNKLKTFPNKKVIFESDTEDDIGKDASVIEVDQSSEDEMISCCSSDDLTISDSEADSLDIVLGEPADDNKDDLQMNVHSNPRYTYKKMINEESVLSDEEHHSDDDGHWGINREDSYRDLLSAKSHHGRYYKPIRCHNCDREGHLSKNCPEPKKVVVCIMCAESGHISRNCPQAICFNCEEPGHEQKNCSAPRRSFNYTCYRCNLQGHDQKQCPDNWRQYHVTITPGKIQHFPKQTKRKRPSCFNCGDEGHFGHECEEERMNKFTRISTPFICRYQTTKEIGYAMRRFDEVEERPLKRSRSEGWLGKIDTATKSSIYKQYLISDKEKTYNADTKVGLEDFRRGRYKKEPSQFVHLAKEHSAQKTGRNNFDKLLFAVSNNEKKKELVSENTIEYSERNKKKKSKKKKERKKNDSQIICVPEKGDGTQELDNEEKISCEDEDKINVHGRDSKNDGSLEIDIVFKEKGRTRYKDKKYETSGQKLKECRNSNDRTVTLDSSSNDLTIVSKTDISETLKPVEASTVKTSSHEKGKEKISSHSLGKKNISNENNKTSFKGKQLKRTQRLEENNLFKQSKGSKGSGRFSTDKIDFTVKRKIKVIQTEDKSDRIMRKFSNKRNDNLRADDLFSLQKIDRLKSSGHFDTPLEEEDIEHQIGDSGWWGTKSKSKKRRNRRKKKKNC